MQVELKDITIGNAQYDATVDFTEEQIPAALKQAALRLLQGKPSGDLEKEILKKLYPEAKKRDEIKVKDEETGEMRPFRRTDIPFDLIGPKLAPAYENVEFVIDENEKGEAIKSKLAVVVSNVREYTGASAAAPKFAREKQFVQGYIAANGGKLKDGSDRTAASFAENRGILAPTEPWAEDTEFLSNVKTWLTEYLAKQVQSE